MEPHAGGTCVIVAVQHLHFAVNDKRGPEDEAVGDTAFILFEIAGIGLEQDMEVAVQVDNQCIISVTGIENAVPQQFTVPVDDAFRPVAEIVAVDGQDGAFTTGEGGCGDELLGRIRLVGAGAELGRIGNLYPSEIHRGLAAVAVDDRSLLDLYADGTVLVSQGFGREGVLVRGIPGDHGILVLGIRLQHNRFRFRVGQLHGRENRHLFRTRIGQGRRNQERDQQNQQNQRDQPQQGTLFRHEEPPSVNAGNGGKNAKTLHYSLSLRFAESQSNQGGGRQGSNLNQIRGSQFHLAADAARTDKNPGETGSTLINKRREMLLHSDR